MSDLRCTFDPYMAAPIDTVQYRSGTSSLIDGRVYIGNSAGFESSAP